MKLSKLAIEQVVNHDYLSHFTGVLMWVVDADLNIIDLTAEFAAYFGYTR